MPLRVTAELVNPARHRALGQVEHVRCGDRATAAVAAYHVVIESGRASASLPRAGGLRRAVGLVPGLDRADGLVALVERAECLRVGAHAWQRTRLRGTAT